VGAAPCKPSDDHLAMIPLLSRDLQLGRPEESRCSLSSVGLELSARVSKIEVPSASGRQSGRVIS
jgi:hypothetical protein